MAAPPPPHQVESCAALLAAFAALVTYAVLGFFCSLLLNVVDTVFLCYATDKEMQVPGGGALWGLLVYGRVCVCVWRRHVFAEHIQFVRACCVCMFVCVLESVCCVCGA